MLRVRLSRSVGMIDRFVVGWYAIRFTLAIAFFNHSVFIAIFIFIFVRLPFSLLLSS